MPPDPHAAAESPAAPPSAEREPNLLRFGLRQWFYFISGIVNQKVIEEAPGPAIPRDKAGAVAEQIAGIMRQMGYDNIGTVEMLMGADGSFSFLEMNSAPDQASSTDDTSL
jgi:hypothetical protein